MSKKKSRVDPKPEQLELADKLSNALANIPKENVVRSVLVLACHEKLGADGKLSADGDDSVVVMSAGGDLVSILVMLGGWLQHTSQLHPEVLDGVIDMCRSFKITNDFREDEEAEGRTLH